MGFYYLGREHVHCGTLEDALVADGWVVEKIYNPGIYECRLRGFKITKDGQSFEEEWESGSDFSLLVAVVKKALRLEEIFNQIKEAVLHAKKKHPHFCDNPVEAVCLMVEELGEAGQAVNDYHWKKLPLDQARKEVLDLIATGVRFLENFK